MTHSAERVRPYKRCLICQGFVTKLEVADVKPIRQAILQDLKEHLRGAHNDGQES